MSSYNKEKTLYVIVFMAIVSAVCGFVLSFLAIALKDKKEIAKEFDRDKEMLIAAKMLSHQGYFLMRDTSFAEYREGKLVASSQKVYASKEQVLDIVKKRFVPYLMDQEGRLHTFEAEKQDYAEYIKQNKTKGYHKTEKKLLYVIYAQDLQEEEGYVIPVKGFGLWDALYGFIALEKDCNTVIGISWYDQKETPGLGADIAEEEWQRQFAKKKIFQTEYRDEKAMQTAPLGIIVVKGRVKDVFNNSYKAESAVDGVSGATLTGRGVTSAYQRVLESYRPFFLSCYKRQQKGNEFS